MKVGEDVILIIIFSLVPLDATHLSPPIFAEEEKKKRLKNERQTQSDALYAVGDSRERERKKERERRDWAGRNRKSTNKYSTSQVPNQVQVLSRPVPFSFPPSPVQASPVHFLDHVAIALLQSPGGGHVDALDFGGLAQFLQVAFAERLVFVLEAFEAFVLSGELDAHGDSHGGGHDLQTDTDAQGQTVVRLVLGAVGEWGPDARRVADGVDEGVGGGAFGRWARDGAGDPRVTGPVHGEDEVHQEQGEVTRAKAVGRHKDHPADDRDRDGVHEEPEAIAHAVRDDRMDHRVEEDEDVGRRAEEEGDDFGVAQRAGQSWEEVLESGGSGDGHVGDGQHVGLGVGQCQLETPDL